MSARSSAERPARTASKFLNLPPDFNPVDATREEVAAFRRESITTVNAKVHDGRYESYLEGRIRKIVFASVLADRARAIAESAMRIGLEPLGGEMKAGVCLYAESSLFRRDLDVRTAPLA